MRIGYSFWGFLGDGITDTPDGGRSHRRPLVDALIARGHDVAFLQDNRDLREAGDDLGGAYAFDHAFPEIDVLFLEWRWPIPGRNTTPCGSAGHTCDFHRQNDLVEHYAVRRGTPMVIWDKDRQLEFDSPWRRHPRTAVCEAALAPATGAHRLLFPVDDRRLDAADADALARRPRAFPLGYVGNQYDRDHQFDLYFAPAAARFPHQVGGKWTTTGRWSHVTFLGRIPFPQVHALYSDSLATVLLLPNRYAAIGQMTQRIFEAVLAGCVPLAPASIQYADRFVPDRLVVASGDQVVEKIRYLQGIAGSPQHAELIAACLERLDLFRLSRQVEALEDILTRAHREVT
ncbi:glycosyltransferase [Streptomyces acidiscabies]|uniref:glycosyltransferase family protein n=1 Tax=Streptomyces acidiscabies TaxID=42234 RepID=UPI0038F63CBB